MKHSVTKRLLSLGLLISLSIPFAINSLHFVLFEHHIHENNFIKGKNLTSNDKTHLICQWEFAIEEFIDAKISIEAPFIYQSNSILFSDKSVAVIKDEYFLLRAPPIS